MDFFSIPGIRLVCHMVDSSEEGWIIPSRCEAPTMSAVSLPIKIPGHHEVVVLKEDLEVGIFLDAIIGLSWRRKGKLRIRVPHCPFLTWQFQKWNFGILTYVPCSAAIV